MPTEAVAGSEIDLSTFRRMRDQQEIRDLVHRYCRSIDRCDFDLLRTCYHPDATDDHGDFRGGVEEFVGYVQRSLARYERTMHFIGNLLVEPDGDRARAETYVVAYHRLASSRTKPERDFVAGLRYVDDFARRDGEWRIAARICVFEWSRVDDVGPGGWTPSDGATMGRRDHTDPVFAPSISEWSR